jgi:hypothetical protein
MRFCKPDGTVERARAGAAADGHDGLDAGVAGSRQHGVAIAIKLRSFEVCVGIDVH